MNKAELVESVAAKSGLTKKDSEKAVAAVVDTIVATLAKGEKVQLVGFGTFETRVHKERTNINPQTKKVSTAGGFLPGIAQRVKAHIDDGALTMLLPVVEPSDDW